MLAKIMAAPNRSSYTDTAIAPAGADEFATLDLYHATNGGEAALARKRRDDAIRAETSHIIRQAAPVGAQGDKISA
jgi:hypothetical protein